MKGPMKVKMEKYIKILQKHKNKVYMGVVIAIFFVFVMILNFHTDYTSDDFKYHFFYDTIYTPHEGTRRISSLWDIILSQINHWKMWNGRVVAHGLLQMILPFGKVFFKIFNSCVYVLLGFLIYKHSIVGKRNNPFLLCIVYILMWFFIPQYGMTVLWASGSANYLWCAAIILSYLLPYRMYALGKNYPEDNIKNLILMAFFGMFAGCMNENTGGGLVLMCILFIVFYKIKGLKIPRWSWVGILSEIVGVVVLVSAPGNYRVSSKTDLDGMLDRIKDVINISSKLTYILLLIIAILMFISFVRGRTMTENTTDRLIPAIYLIGAYAMMAVLILSASYPERAWFTAVICMIIAAAWFYSEINIELKNKTLHNNIKIGIVAASFIVFLFSYNVEFKNINTTYEVVKEGVEKIEQAVAEGKNEVVIPIVKATDSKYDPFNGTSYITKSSGEWLNSWMAEYYGIDKIIGK